MEETELSNLELLCSLELVNWLPLSRIPEVLACLRELKFKQDEMVVRKGTIGESFYIIKWGMLKVYGTDENQNELWSKFYHRGDFFGETVILNKGPRMANVICMTDSTLLEISKNDFNWVFEKQSQKVYYSFSFMEMI